MEPPFLLYIGVIQYSCQDVAGSEIPFAHILTGQHVLTKEKKEGYKWNRRRLSCGLFSMRLSRW